MIRQITTRIMDSLAVQCNDWIEYILINYRWLFVCCFLLPLSVIYDCYFYIRNLIIFRLSTAPKNHSAKVKEVQRQVRQWISDNEKRKPDEKTKLCTGRPGWLTMSFREPKYKKSLKFTKIDMNLVDVLNIDETKRLVTVEPLVTMGQLTATLLTKGWTIPVVPELDDLTVGGLIMGTGIETSSHIYGLFQHICVSFQLVMADGSLVTCNASENSQLFYSVPWSYGTIGLLVAAQIQIIPAKQFVKLSYIPCYSLQDTVNVLQAESDNKNNDVVEGIVFDKDQSVVMIGNFTDTSEQKLLNPIGNHYKPWFYKNVEEKLEKHETVTEYIPIRQYYHRHTRSIFWELSDIIPFGNHPIFRYLLGWAVPPKVSFLKLTQTESIKRLYERNHMIQDMLIPMSDAKQSIEMFHDTVEIYPLWLCPFVLKMNRNKEGLLQPKTGKEELYLDIGAYGTPRKLNFEPKTTTRAIEHYVRSVKGFQMLYADSYMTEEEFEEMFDHTSYNKMRELYNCDTAFPRIYEKVNKNARH